MSVPLLRMNWRGSVRSHCSVSPGCLLGFCPHWASSSWSARSCVAVGIGSVGGEGPRRLDDAAMAIEMRIARQQRDFHGGSTPRAVVIHLTYMNGENQIWIRHFTSETNDSISNVQGKFAEAANKAVTYCTQRGLNNSAISELISYNNNEHYPGLGTVKKISIKNHLLVISQFLKNR